MATHASITGAQTRVPSINRRNMLKGIAAAGALAGCAGTASETPNRISPQMRLALAGAMAAAREEDQFERTVYEPLFQSHLAHVEADPSKAPSLRLHHARKQSDALGERTYQTQWDVVKLPAVSLADLRAKLDFTEARELQPDERVWQALAADIRRLAAATSVPQRPLG